MSSSHITGRRGFWREAAWPVRAAILTVCALIACAALGPWITPHDPNAVDLARRLQTADAAHWFGTDHLGRDILSRLIAGAGVSLGAVAIAMALTCAASLDAAPPGVRRVSGSIAINGIDCVPADIRGSRVATILQNPRSAFNPVRTMRQHAMESFIALGIPPGERDTRIHRAMADAGLADATRILSLHAFEMSGGMLQRMMIALALASEAPFLFADEPTTDLDLIVQRDILDLLERLKHERQLGLLIVTHDMGVVAALADRVAVMDAGCIVETGTVMDVFHRPAHPVTRRLVDAHLALYRHRSVA